VTENIDPRKAKRRLHGGQEIAFLDVREAGEFGEGHPLFATPCPYSRLELLAPALVPNRRAPVLLIDGGDGVAARAARRLEALGYEDVAIVGGAADWGAAGFTLFKGVNVPSKTLGELAEAAWHPAMLDAGTLAAWRAAGRPFHLFDARPPAEYSKMNVPGARCLPNGELAHRFAAAVSARDVPIVVNCAGRTRGIVGAIGLRIAGVENPVLALENGTQGWALGGEVLERGTPAVSYPELDEAALAESHARARRISETWGIPWIDPAGVEELWADADRTTYVFDVRSAEEFAAGHFPAAVHAPGGQLAQATDQWIAVRRARVALCDDTGLRAALAAFWLRQLGFETYVLTLSPPLNSGLPESSIKEPKSGKPDFGRGRGEGGRPPGQADALPLVSPQAVAAGLAAGMQRLIDLRPSPAYRAAHPAGAEWGIRPKLDLPPTPALPRKVEGSMRLVLLSEEPAVAALAAMDLAEAGYADVRLLAGGMSAWRDAGLPVESTQDSPSPDEAVDFLRFVHDRHDGNLDASRQYIAWEQGLVAQLDPEERAEFRLETPFSQREKVAAKRPDEDSPTIAT
jgi:rhodanese-related sulfurtransferase